MLGLLIWFVCGFISSGFLCAYFTRRYMGQALEMWRNTDLGVFLIVFGAGPFGMLSTLGFLYLQDKYWGFRIPFTKITKEEWEMWATAYQKRLYGREWSVYSRSLEGEV